MKTKTIHHIFTGLFAYLIACSVMLAHTHVGDIVKHSSNDKLKIPTIAARADDIHAKVMGEMHTHIDKTALKNVAADTAPTRRRAMTPEESVQEDSLLERFTAQLLLLRVMMTMPVSVIA